MARKPPPELRDLAKRRLQRLLEPSPEEFAREVEEARRQGYKFLALGPVHYWIRDYSLIPEDGESRGYANQVCPRAGSAESLARRVPGDYGRRARTIQSAPAQRSNLGWSGLR